MPGSRSAVVTGLLALAASLLTAGPAHAAAPSNDDFDNATIITSVPYSGASSTVEATRAPGEDDPYCGGYDASVWWSFTPSADTTIVVDTAGSDFDTILSAVSGTRDALNWITCNVDSRYGSQSEVKLRVSAGTTYHFMVGGLEHATGAVVLNVLPALTNVTLTVDKRGTVDRHGRVTVHGSVTCDVTGVGFMDVTGLQSSHQFTAQSNDEPEYDCGPDVSTWYSGFYSTTGSSFMPGKLTVTWQTCAFDAYNVTVCANGEQTVTLVSSH
jgi:hypothetical protein